jgi:hypothetical protein
MLVWLSGVENTKEEPNENYGRELMELFTLGAADPATGYPYSEDDVREQARAHRVARLPDDFGYGARFDAPRHRPKRFGRRGTTGTTPAALRPSPAACLFVRKLWLLHPPPPPARGGARRLFTGVRCGEAGRRAILRHPRLYKARG